MRKQAMAKEADPVRSDLHIAKRQPRGAGAVEKLPSGRYRARVRVAGEYYNAPQTFDAKVDARHWLKREVDAVAARDVAAAGHGAPQATAPVLTVKNLRRPLARRT